MGKFKSILFSLIVFALLITPYQIPIETIQPASYFQKENILKKILTINLTSNNSNKHNLISPVLKLTFADQHGPIATATGFSIKYDSQTDLSFILTNAHFCEIKNIASGFFIYEKSDKLANHYISKYEAEHQQLTFIRMDTSIDLCLLLVNEKIEPIILENKNYRVKTMDNVTTVGAPAGNFPIIIDTYISGFIDRRSIEYLTTDGEPYLLLSQPTSGGQSGSPVYNSKHKVIGIIFFKLSGLYGGGAIPLSDIYKFLNN